MRLFRIVSHTDGVSHPFLFICLDLAGVVAATNERGRRAGPLKLVQVAPIDYQMISEDQSRKYGNGRAEIEREREREPKSQRVKKNK